ncbi:hypothetical protein HHK36_017769 [Tetracentron sinense]|uniref:Nuclear transcription factor Y subunit n=1 Tax=Tetracentron sinense TaxID=13715 RepID=A0A834Z2L9_TETSI|nr:hypothetical protein HHK36_017769 [Tetracentron sinense]
MQSEPKDANKLEPNTHSFPPSTICSQPWWRGRGVEYNAISPDVLAESASKSPSMEHPNGGVGAKAGHSQPNGGLNEGAAVNKEMQTITAKQSGSDGNYGQEHQHLQHVASAIPPSMGEYLVPPQMELVGHSIACAPYPYSDPYYGGIMTAYGPQALVQPHLLGMHHTRMPLPLEMAEEPVYVNAKQYHGILRRRQSRAKAELEKKVVKVRKASLAHKQDIESEHQQGNSIPFILNTNKVRELDVARPVGSETNEEGLADQIKGLSFEAQPEMSDNPFGFYPIIAQANQNRMFKHKNHSTELGEKGEEQEMNKGENSFGIEGTRMRWVLNGEINEESKGGSDSPESVEQGEATSIKPTKIEVVNKEKSTEGRMGISADVHQQHHPNSMEATSGNAEATRQILFTLSGDYFTKSCPTHFEEAKLGRDGKTKTSQSSSLKISPNPPQSRESVKNRHRQEIKEFSPRGGMPSPSSLSTHPIQHGVDRVGRVSLMCSLSGDIEQTVHFHRGMIPLFNELKGKAGGGPTLFRPTHKGFVVDHAMMVMEGSYRAVTTVKEGPYLHESRHQHAVRRARGCGGRFLNTKNLDCNATNPTPEKAKGSGAVLSTLSASSTDSESETLPSDSTGHLDCSSSQQEIKEPLVRDMHGAHTYHNVDTNGNSNYYQHHHDHLSSTYCSLSGERGEEGDCSGQQRGSIPVNRAPHRTLTIQ